MSKRIFTVDEVAQILDMHSRTIRRYIKEGSLNARKVGGQWRIKEEDIQNFMEDPWYKEKRDEINGGRLDSFIRGKGSAEEGKLQICTIVDYYVDNSEEVRTICNKIGDLVGGVEKDIRFEYSFISEVSKARFTFWGDPKVISDLLLIFSE